MEMKCVKHSTSPLIFGILVLLLSCSKDEESLLPANNPNRKTASIMPKSYNGKGVISFDCMTLTEKEIKIEFSNSANDLGVNGSLIINGKVVFNGLLPPSNSPITLFDTLKNLGYNYLIFNSNQFPGNWAKANIKIFTGPASRSFSLISDTRNNDGLDLVVRDGNLACPGPGPEDSLLGDLTFWINYDPNCGPKIAIEITGHLETHFDTITRYYLTPDIPTCGSSGCANFSLLPGTYTFSASCPGKTWGPAQVAVVEGICKTALLN
jgi:hypothetical protein